jgi:dihydrolipoamide dehydrogenase
MWSTSGQRWPRPAESSGLAEVVVGGVAAALTAARLGAKVTVVERAAPGGICVHAGCIPSACYHRSAAALAECRAAGRFGVAPAEGRLEWDRVQAWVSATVREASGQVRTALTAAGVELLPGVAGFTGPAALQVGGRSFTGIPIILATGAAAVAPSFPGKAAIPVLTSDGAMALDSVPESVVVAGSGRFSLEWADLLSTLGARVTVVTPEQRMLPAEDVDIAGYLQVLLEERGVEFMLATPIEAVEGKTVIARGRPIPASAVISADSRTPNLADLELAVTGVEQAEHGGVKVDPGSRTSASGIFAVGDVTGPPWLSNRARAMGTAAARNALGESVKVRSERIPRSVNTRPELAAVGLTEEEAVGLHRHVAVGYGELVTNLRALTLGEAKGALKLVVDSEYGEILGAHMVGVGSVEVIAQVAAAIELEADYRQLARMHHLHPSLAELVSEAAASCEPSMAGNVGS